MRRDHIDQRKLYFILVRDNMACAFVQKGHEEDDVIVEIIDHTQEDLINDEIRKCLLAEPESAYMASVGRWEYMKEYCFKSMNLYGSFMWSYHEPLEKEIRCGFSVHIKNHNLDKDE